MIYTVSAILCVSKIKMALNPTSLNHMVALYDHSEKLYYSQFTRNKREIAKEIVSALQILCHETVGACEEGAAEGHQVFVKV